MKDFLFAFSTFPESLSRTLSLDAFDGKNIDFIYSLGKKSPETDSIYSDNDLKSRDKSYSVIIKYLEWTGWTII